MGSKITSKQKSEKKNIDGKNKNEKKKNSPGRIRTCVTPETPSSALTPSNPLYFYSKEPLSTTPILWVPQETGVCYHYTTEPYFLVIGSRQLPSFKVLAD